MTDSTPDDPPSRSTRHSDTQPSGPAGPPFSTSELSAIVRRLTWQQRAALRVLARTPSRVRQRSNSSHHVDTQTSSHIAITTWHALERKGLAYRDHTAHPASLMGQRLALTRKGLAVLNHISPVTYPSTTTQLRPPAPPPHFTSHPSPRQAQAPHARRR
ncbi:hypothetical protein [Streptomyces ureilyticus]|uniref:MarR family transcriptional regulator n=1 Tax=Streptomyces ureilyticus TaxID=1775131 RepID=A0ABX0E1R2_9ACTN|nr:hypothetical protein [Streptomyces ureilyticus]NGO45122.1 hypothetical protein [Streptomyces ureilyticus]